MQVILYAYCESNLDAPINLKYFLNHGLIDCDIYLIVNGTCSLDLTKYPQLKVYYRPNTGYDFGGWIYGLKQLTQEYDYYIFLNCSVCGPFIPPYVKIKWTQVLIDLFKDDVHLVGPTINVVPENVIINRTFKVIPVVQTYCFALTNAGFQLVKPTIFEKEFSNFLEVGINQEVQMSREILNHGWNLNCLIPEYADRDYRNIKKIFNPDSISTLGDYAFIEPNKLFGRTPHPYEVLFVKNSSKWLLHRPVIDSFLKWENSVDRIKNVSSPDQHSHTGI